MYTFHNCHHLLRTGKLQYTKEVFDAPEVEGEGKPRRCIFSEKLLTEPENGVKDLYSNFQKGLEISRHSKYLGHRPIKDGVAQDYIWETYQQVADHIENLSNALYHRGYRKGAIIGIYAINCPEWIYVEQTCNASSFYTVPLYDTLGMEAIQHIVNQTEMSFIFAQADKVNKLLKNISNLSSIKTITLIGNLTEELKESGKQANVEILEIKELENEGKGKPGEPTRPTGDDISTIMYTSGTTGLPKGALISHDNFLAISASMEYLGKLGHMAIWTTKDIHISYLPLAHIFERVNVTYITGLGAAMGFYQGDPLKLLDDMEHLKPTYFPSVPRVLNKLYSKINGAIEATGGITSYLFNSAVESKKKGLKDGHKTHWIWDRFVFSKIKEKVGGCVQNMLVGSAPISPEVVSFFRLAFSAEIFEAYGLTESCGATSMTLVGDYDTNSVGSPLPCSEIKLIDVPDMNYTSKDTPNPRGEICLRGPHIFKGYYKEEEKTKEALDKDGWLHTGDIGLWDEKGRLCLVDRKKNIFKLAQGEYVAPEKIESAYVKSKWVGQIFVHGDSFKAFLVAVVIPNDENLLPWCKENGIEGKTLEDVIHNEKVKQHILEDMLKVGKQLDLKSFEQVKDIHLDHRLFTIENGLLTPTFKLKRHKAREYYNEVIKALVESIEQLESEKEKQKNLEEHDPTKS